MRVRRGLNPLESRRAVLRIRNWPPSSWRPARERGQIPGTSGAGGDGVGSAPSWPSMVIMFQYSRASVIFLSRVELALTHARCLPLTLLQPPWLRCHRGGTGPGTSEHARTPVRCVFLLAAGLGFEPRQPHPECGGLPLPDPALKTESAPDSSELAWGGGLRRAGAGPRRDAGSGSVRLWRPWGGRCRPLVLMSPAGSLVSIRLGRALASGSRRGGG